MKLGAPWNWYALDSKLALELLKVFVKNTESQIKATIHDYKKKKKSELVVLSEEHGIAQVVEYYGGLDDMTWDLKELYGSYYPNLQRKSAFLTLYAFLEHEMETLANKLMKESGLKAKPDDLAGKGVYRSFTYMQVIAGLNIDKGDNRWNKIHEINKLRNLVVHSDGHLSREKEKRKSEEAFIARMKPHLKSKGDEVILRSTLLEYVLEQFDELFKYIDKGIQAKYERPFRRTVPVKRRKDKVNLP